MIIYLTYFRKFTLPRHQGTPKTLPTFKGNALPQNDGKMTNGPPRKCEIPSVYKIYWYLMIIVCRYIHSPAFPAFTTIQFKSRIWSWTLDGDNICHTSPSRITVLPPWRKLSGHGFWPVLALSWTRLHGLIRSAALLFWKKTSWRQWRNNIK